MEKEIKQYLNERAKSLLINHISIDDQDKNLITKIFRTKPDRLVSLNIEELRTYLIALTQYYIYFVYQSNLARTKHFISKKIFNDNVTRKIIGIKNGTVAEKMRIACDEDEELKKAELAVAKSEAESKLLEGMEKPILEYINVLKRLVGEAAYHG